MSQSKLDIRPELVGLKPYQTFPSSLDDIRLNTNENPYNFSVVSGASASFENAEINRYPDDSYSALKEAIFNAIYAERDSEGSEYKNWISADVSGRMTVANGSNEIMSQIFTAFGGPTPKAVYPECARRALTFTPSYSMYPQYARDSYTNLIKIPRNTSDFSLTSDVAIQAIKDHKPSIVIITNPNNPTGNWTDINVIRDVLDFTNALDLQPIVVIDEAYVDFREHSEDGASNFRSAIELLPKYDNLLIVRTLSKALALAGLRIGYAFGAKQIIDALKIVHLPYNLSTVIQELTKSIVLDSVRMKEVEDSVKIIRNERNKLFKNLEELAEDYQIKPYRSQANFILIELNSAELPSLLDKFMRDNDVIVRLVGGETRFRVTIGSPNENERFLAVFKQFLEHNLGRGETL